MGSFPQDQFDRVPADLQRLGAHRAPARRGRGLLALGLAILAALVLTAAGLFALTKLVPGFTVPLPDWALPMVDEPAPPLPEAAPVTDPAAVPEDLDLTLAVLNATASPGLQATVGDLLEERGWPDPVRSAASSDDVEETVVYYRSAASEGVARGLVDQLDVGRVVLSDAYPGAEVTIVLGSDYSPPSG